MTHFQTQSHKSGPLEPTLKPYANVPDEDITAMIAASIVDYPGSSLRELLYQVNRVEHSRILVAYAGNSPVALAYITPSMHSFDHWGLNLAAVKDGFSTWEGLGFLVDNLTQHAHATISASQQPPKALALSVGTILPEVFHACGFQTVHTHLSSDRRETSWMISVTATDRPTYYSVDMSNPSILPRQFDFIRPLRSALEVKQASQIIEKTWGLEQANAFMQEVQELQGYPGSAVYGIILNEHVRGVGVIIKALHHPEVWSRAWIVVDPELRGSGFATKIIQSLIYHAESHHRQFCNGPMVMEGQTNPITVAPEYYAKFGNMIVAEITTSNGRTAWSMRITAPLPLTGID